MSTLYKPLVALQHAGVMVKFVVSSSIGHTEGLMALHHAMPIFAMSDCEQFRSLSASLLPFGIKLRSLTTLIPNPAINNVVYLASLPPGTQHRKHPDVTAPPISLNGSPGANQRPLDAGSHEAAVFGGPPVPRGATRA